MTRSALTKVCYDKSRMAKVHYEKDSTQQRPNMTNSEFIMRKACHDKGLSKEMPTGKCQQSLKNFQQCSRDASIFRGKSERFSMANVKVEGSSVDESNLVILDGVRLSWVGPVLSK